MKGNDYDLYLDNADEFLNWIFNERLKGITLTYELDIPEKQLPKEVES